jgi:hypothetical protein
VAGFDRAEASAGERERIVTSIQFAATPASLRAVAARVLSPVLPLAPRLRPAHAFLSRHAHSEPPEPVSQEPQPLPDVIAI